MNEKWMEPCLKSVGDYHELVEKAKIITKGAPFWMTAAAEFSELDVDLENKSATLSWPETHSGYYDSCSIERQTCTFPLALLLASESDLTAWKVEQKRIYDEKQAAYRKRHAENEAIARERNERLLYHKLKAKYEHGVDMDDESTGTVLRRTT